MQGSQIIDSKYGPIHQRMSTSGAPNTRSNMRGSQSIKRGIALDTMSGAHTLANHVNHSNLRNPRLHNAVTPSEPATAPPKRPTKAAMLQASDLAHLDLSRE